MIEQESYAYWLYSVAGMGRHKIKKVVEQCGCAKEAYYLTEEQWNMLYGIEERDIIEILKSKKNWDVEEKWQELLKEEISFVSMEHSLYPKRLRDIEDNPFGIFFKGRLPDEEKVSVAMVGARSCSQYGRAVALSYAKALALAGVQVISGMAQGIDSFGHWGAIDGGGKTYGVLGSGVDVCYPKGAAQLYGRIQKQGGLLSEYLPGTPPKPGLFPQRNRIISGLADAIILVEARNRSGSLITADFALEQGKDIYAVPGRLDDELSSGCNGLISQGAGILLSVGQLLQQLGIEPIILDENLEKEKNTLEKEELLVYSCFDLHAKNIEELQRATKMNIPLLADALERLQRKGLIVEIFKNQYCKK